MRFSKYQEIKNKACKIDENGNCTIKCDECFLQYAAICKNLESCIEFESLYAKEAEQVLKLFEKFNRIVKTEANDESNRNKEMLQMWETSPAD